MASSSSSSSFSANFFSRCKISSSYSINKSDELCARSTVSILVALPAPSLRSFSDSQRFGATSNIFSSTVLLVNWLGDDIGVHGGRSGTDSKDDDEDDDEEEKSAALPSAGEEDLDSGVFSLLFLGDARDFNRACTSRNDHNLERRIFAPKESSLMSFNDATGSTVASRDGDVAIILGLLTFPRKLDKKPLFCLL